MNVNTNIEWLNEIFSRPHLATLKLVPSFAPKWFAIKHGKAMYNPKQVIIADNIEFKCFVLNELYNKMYTLDVANLSPNINKELEIISGELCKEKIK